MDVAARPWSSGSLLRERQMKNVIGTLVVAALALDTFGPTTKPLWRCADMEAAVSRDLRQLELRAGRRIRGQGNQYGSSGVGSPCAVNGGAYAGRIWATPS